MLARHADALFWAGRYLERAEDTARMLQVTLRSSATVGPERASERYHNLLHTLRLDEPEGQITPASMLDLLVLSPESRGSIVTVIGKTRENLRSVREQIPSELWENSNRLHLRLRESGFAERLAADPSDSLDEIKLSCQTLAGIIATAMARDEGHRFLTLGQSLERGLMTCRLLYVRYPQLSPSSYDETALTLRSASALEAYQRAFRASADPRDVAHFLLLSEDFPRAVLFCLRLVEQQLSALSAAATEPNPPQRLVGQVRSRLEFADFEELVADLASVLAETEEGLRHAAEAVAHQYFRNAEIIDLHSQLLLPGASS